MGLTTDDFRKALTKEFTAARSRGASSVEINSGQLHRQLGIYPNKGHSMPTCCNVMHAELKSGDEIVSQPPKGRGATLTIRYRLPR